MNAEVHWFCSLNEGVLPPELCRELFTLVGESAELLVFGQQVMDLQLTDDLDKFHTMMSEPYTGAKSGEPPLALELGLESSTTAIPAVAAPDAADPVLVTSGPVDAEPGLALVNANAEFNWNRLPSLTGVEEMSDKEVLNLRAYINDEVEGMQSLDASLRQLLAGNRLRRRKRIRMAPTRASLPSACRNTHIGPQKSVRSRSAWKL